MPGEGPGELFRGFSTPVLWPSEPDRLVCGLLGLRLAGAAATKCGALEAWRQRPGAFLQVVSESGVVGLQGSLQRVGTNF